PAESSSQPDLVSAVWDLQSNNVLSLEALIAVDHGELHLLAFFQVAEAIATNGTEMNKHIISAVAGDKAKALRAIEPLNGSLLAFSYSGFGTPFLQISDYRVQIFGAAP